MSNDQKYLQPVSRTKPCERVILSNVCDALSSTKRWFETSYNLCKTVASEILVFMLSDWIELTIVSSATHILLHMR